MLNKTVCIKAADSRNYREVKVPDKRGKVIVISGPSGVGKGTICAELLRRVVDTCLSVSATTRERAASEIEGKDYYFLTREAFEGRRADGLFLEWAEVFGNYYGTPKGGLDEMLSTGKSVLLEIDVQGGMQAKAAYPDAIMIFILPPDEHALYTRIQGRGRDSEESVQTRLSEARAEMSIARGHYEHSVVNDDLEQAVHAIVQIIRTASAAC